MVGLNRRGWELSEPLKVLYRTDVAYDSTPNTRVTKDTPMSVSIRIPTTLRTLTAGSSSVTVEGSTVAEVLSSLEAAHPGFQERLIDENGALRRFVNVFVSDDDVRFLDGLETPVPDGAEVSIIPAVAGG